MVLELRDRSGATNGSAWRGWLAGWLAACAVLLVLAVGCGTELATPTPTPEPVDPRMELQRTVAQLMALQSVAFDLEHVVGTTNIMPGVLMNRAYGSAVVPGTFEVTVESELRFPRSYLEIGMTSVDGASYMTNVLSGEWEEVSPESLPINLADLGVTLANIVEQVQEPELLGEERLGDVEVYRLSGSVTSEVLKELVPTAGTGFPVALEIWTDRDSGMLRQALITGQVVLTDREDTQRRLTLDRANEPVTVEPPQL